MKQESKLALVEIIDQTELTDTKSEQSSVTPWGNDEVSPGKKVTLNFSLALIGVGNDASGRLIDNNFDKAPVSFIMGDGSLLPGFEKSILGFKAGDEEAINIPSENAFGGHNEDNVQQYPTYQFPADLAFEKGLMINFSDAAGNEQAGVIKEFDSEKVMIDFNHPLAGKEIVFTVKIIAVDTI